MVSSLSSASPICGSGAEAGSHLACAVERSTAYTNLRRILALISSLPPSPPEKAGGEIHSPSAQSGGEKRPVDVRLRLAPAWETGFPGKEDRDAGLISSACSVVVGGETANAADEIVSGSFSGGILGANSSTGRSPDGECDGHGAVNDEDEEVKHVRRREVVDDGEGRPCSEITNVKGNECPGESLGSSEEGRSPGDATRNTKKKNIKEGYLGLLLEAVRQVSGELVGMEGEEKKDAAEKTEKKGKEKKGAALEPVVRSKRGRSQVLPSKYRDSVLEPWSKQARRWR